MRIPLVLTCLGLLAACGDGQPFYNETPTDPDTGEELVRTVPLPPGTEDPSRNRSIDRHEGDDGQGGGLVTDVLYDAANDTFTVDNLGFDGANVYSRGERVATLNGYNVYDADVLVTDDVSGAPIVQVIPYRALYGESRNSVDGNPRSSFAIVRTGGYVDYGFGGFVYERNGSVTLPTSGQARFSGDYAGVRVFGGRPGLEYTSADMTIAIDFEDFNSNEAIQGNITNREAFTQNGRPIPTGGEDELALPDLNFVIVAGAETLDDNGEISGNLGSFIVDPDTGEASEYETGVYYGIISGDATDPADGGEIVGVVVIESDDPRFSGVTAQETGGFILYR